MYQVSTLCRRTGNGLSGQPKTNGRANFELRQWPLLADGVYAAGMLLNITEIIKWVGTALFAIGGIAISVWVEVAAMVWPFMCFAIGHTLWFVAGIVLKDKSLIGLNAMYLPLDSYAVFLRI